MNSTIVEAEITPMDDDMPGNNRINYWYYINPFLIFLPFILFTITIVKFIKARMKIHNDMVDENEKKVESKKSIKKLILGILGSCFTWFVLEVINILTSGATYKPVIYLYPKKKQKISVKLGNKDRIIVSYPKYIDGWNVLAEPNGDLLDLDTNKKLYSLYYENKNGYDFRVEKDGFVVRKEDIATFLEEKLEILGLNYKEKEEFIIYWLPELQKYDYNYIRFATMDEINKNMPLEFSDKPDTLIRVIMTYKPLNKQIEVEEQKLEKQERKGYVAVEWGGTKVR